MGVHTPVHTCARTHRTIRVSTFRSGSSVEAGKVGSFQEQMSAGGDERKKSQIALSIVGFGELNTAGNTDEETASVIFFKSNIILK